MVFCPAGNFLTVQTDIGVPEIVESIYLVEIVEFAEFVELCGNCGIVPKYQFLNEIGFLGVLASIDCGDGLDSS